MKHGEDTETGAHALPSDLQERIDANRADPTRLVRHDRTTAITDETPRTIYTQKELDRIFTLASQADPEQYMETEVKALILKLRADQESGAIAVLQIPPIGPKSKGQEYIESEAFQEAKRRYGGEPQ